MLFNQIQQFARDFPAQIALQNHRSEHLSYANLAQEIIDLAQKIVPLNCAAVALAVENNFAWIVCDIALLNQKISNVPLPHFFSDSQLAHAVQDAGADILITDNSARFLKIFENSAQVIRTLTVAGQDLTVLKLQNSPQVLPKNTVKITYTSGTTGAPKGVCLSEESMLNVANSVKQMVKVSAQFQHLCVLPLATLLENVAGVYATLLAGGTVHIWPNSEIGFSGSAFDIHQLCTALASSQANTAILLPELLNALVISCEGGAKLPHLKFVAVGGASVAPSLLQRAAALNLPVFEGYGLSECASVVTLNTPAAHKIGTVGKPLPHIQLKIIKQEVMVKGAQFLGYTTQKNGLQDWLPTGDIGELDADGFLILRGRKKNRLITSFGRNISPEWIERDLTQMPVIAQACMFGEAKPFNIAIISPKAHTLPTQIAEAINLTNSQLPDYARISQFVIADAPFSVQNGQLTPNGRLKREAIFAAYAKQISALYD